ncbi:MAG: putative bifunctional diguanylate cyclase/phosphodiesterase, partial [Sphingosinicella sp.]
MRKGRFASLSRSGEGAPFDLRGLWRGRGAARPDDALGDPAAAFAIEFEQSGSGWFWETDADGIVDYVSPALAVALEREHEDIIGRPFAELLLVEEEDDCGHRPALGFHLAGRFPFANVLVTPNGAKNPCWVLAGRPRFDEVGRFLGFRGVGVGLSPPQREQAKSIQLAGRDSLTGLPNRARMRAMLDEAIANSADRKEGFALFLMDLDRFKQVNDTLGHPVGDLLLKEVAQRLSAVIGSHGQAGRLGGDEFEVLLPGIDEEGALAELAGRLIQKVSAPYVVRGHNISIGASAGIAISRPGKTFADAMVKESDLALYAAKKAGRGTYRFFASHMHAEETERQMLESDLNLAVVKGQMRLVYQPVVRIEGEGLVGFEALLRWQHPTRGLLEPAEFLPIAEAGKLIAGIGEWVIHNAFAEAAKWPPHLRLTVNLSLDEVEQPGIVATVAGALAASGLAPARVEFDLVEAALLADNADIRAVLAGLKGLGVRLALDDFGLGSASVNSLRSAPLDGLKIHPELLRAGLGDGNRAKALLAALVGLAGGLGMTVTVEGAETRDDLDLATRLGCGEIQGFLFGRPMVPEEALELAESSKPVAHENVRPRPPRHSLIRRGALTWRGGTLPVRLRNISAEGAMFECGQELKKGAKVELDLSGDVRLAADVRWSAGGRTGVRFAETFDLKRLGSARGSAAAAAAAAAAPPVLKPDYLAGEFAGDK